MVKIKFRKKSIIHKCHIWGILLLIDASEWCFSKRGSKFTCGTHLKDKLKNCTLDPLKGNLWSWRLGSWIFNKITRWLLHTFQFKTLPWRIKEQAKHIGKNREGECIWAYHHRVAKLNSSCCSESTGCEPDETVQPLPTPDTV